jgi:hypothetical protein
MLVFVYPFVFCIFKISSQEIPMQGPLGGIPTVACK